MTESIERDREGVDDQDEVDDATFVASRRGPESGDDATQLSSRRGSSDGSLPQGPAESAAGGADGAGDRGGPGDATEDRTVLSRVRGADAGQTVLSPDARPHDSDRRPSVPEDHVATDTWSGTFGAADAPYPPRSGGSQPPAAEDEPPATPRPAVHVLTPAEVTRRRDAARRRRVGVAVATIAIAVLVVIGALVGAAVLLSGL